MQIQGCRFVITGGNRGIGLAVAQMAASMQAHVYIVARSWDGELESELKKIGAASVHLIKCDLSVCEQVEELSVRLINEEIDILFNNAGVLTGGLIENQELDEIYKMFQINLNAVVHLSRAIIPGMINRGRGKIINNSSVSAFMHFPCASTYAASKAAIAAFTSCLESELIGTGVTTLCLITPGIKTRMFDEIAAKYSKNMSTPKEYLTPTEYANKIKKAIESDISVLYPQGSTAIALWVARHLNPAFRFIIRKIFHRA